KIMQPDINVAVTESLECSNNFSLSTDQAADHNIQQKSSNPQKDGRKQTCHLFQLIDITLEYAVRSLPVAFLCIFAAIALQQQIQPADNIVGICTRLHGEHYIIK